MGRRKRNSAASSKCILYFRVITIVRQKAPASVVFCCIIPVFTKKRVVRLLGAVLPSFRMARQWKWGELNPRPNA